MQQTLSLNRLNFIELKSEMRNYETVKRNYLIRWTHSMLTNLLVDAHGKMILKYPIINEQVQA